MRIKKYVYVGKVETNDGRTYVFDDIWACDEGDACDELQKRYLDFKLITIKQSEFTLKYLTQEFGFN